MLFALCLIYAISSCTQLRIFVKEYVVMQVLTGVDIDGDGTVGGLDSTLQGGGDVESSTWTGSLNEASLEHKLKEEDVQNARECDEVQVSAGTDRDRDGTTSDMDDLLPAGGDVRRLEGKTNGANLQHPNSLLDLHDAGESPAPASPSIPLPIKISQDTPEAEGSPVTLRSDGSYRKIDSEAERRLDVPDEVPAEHFRVVVDLLQGSGLEHLAQRLISAYGIHSSEDVHRLHGLAHDSSGAFRMSKVGISLDQQRRLLRHLRR